MGLALPDDVPHRVVGDEDLEGGHHAAVGPRDQALRDDRAERRSELDPDLVLAPGGEDVDDAVDGLGRVVGVQGREDQVTRLGQRQRQLDGLEVAHLTHEEDVGVLPQGRAQRTLEGGAVGPHLSLGHGREAVLVDVLDRVLDGEDVHRPRLVDAVDDGGQRGRLPRSGRTGQEHQAAGEPGQPLGDGRQPELARRSGCRRGSCGAPGPSRPSG